uniref:Putative secreted protein n=1 Tax=Ixodes ricinus TaxID=34613 RepID=A0A6B0UP02_IXORI
MVNKCIITIIVIIIAGHFIFARQEISVVPSRPMFRQRAARFPRHRVRTSASHHAYVRWVRFLPSYGRHQSVGGKQESCSERGGGATETQSHMLSKLCRRTYTGKAQWRGENESKASFILETC